jgi:hypothetical protein
MFQIAQKNDKSHNLIITFSIKRQTCILIYLQSFVGGLTDVLFM